MDLNTPTTATTLLATLRESIIEGGLPAGTHLPELELARRHGVARSTVREAIAGLVNRGLVVRRHNAGARVCIPSREELRDLYELRECLE
ncbi:MAG: GntR family transcriptional regulator, partial [Halofilum sp. (in: g-proteobacteria)]